MPSYCSPLSSTGMDGSPESRTLNDTQSSDWRAPGSSSIRSESPRQTQYALGNIQLQALASQQHGSFSAQVEPKGQNLVGVFPNDSWDNNVDGPAGMNPIANNNANVNNPFDTDMSDAANQSSSNSNGLTPASSNTHPSTTNSNYSPPHIEDDNPGMAQFQSQNNAPYSTYPADASMFANTNLLNEKSARSPGNQNTVHGQENPFKVPSEWESTTGTTPGFTGMSPDGGWEKLLQDGGWEKMMQDGTWIDQNQRNGMTPR